MSSPYNLPTRDWITTTLNGAISSSASTATIGTGLNIPSTNGILQIDYSSTTAVGSDNGPETVTYTSYNSGTGALSGLTRGADGGTGVAHANGAVVQAGPSILYFNQDLGQLIQQTAFGTWSPSFTGFSANPTVGNARYFQIGKFVFAFCTISAAGTSNATTYTTTLPVAAKITMDFPVGSGQDNGVTLTTPARATTTAGSTTLNLYKDMSGAAWTSSGSKNVNWSIVYEAN